MADAIEVRCLAATDADVLLRVAPNVFDHAVRGDYLQAFFDDAHSLLVVAIDDGVVVGMASGLVYGHPDKPPQLFVNEVGVAPTHQRRGLGRGLVGCLLARGRELGCTEGWVATEEENTAARRVYAATGGREEASRAVVFTYALLGDGEAEAVPGAAPDAAPDASPEAAPGAAPDGAPGGLPGAVAGPERVS